TALHSFPTRRSSDLIRSVPKAWGRRFRGGWPRRVAKRRGGQFSYAVPCSPQRAAEASWTWKDARRPPDRNEGIPDVALGRDIEAVIPRKTPQEAVSSRGSGKNIADGVG